MEAQKVTMSKEDWDKLSTEEHATICQMIVEALHRKLHEVTELFDKFCTAYPQEIAATGISLVANIDSKAFNDPFNLVYLGTTEGLMHNVKNLTKGFQMKLEEMIANDKEAD